jgi:hypothetical protein
MKIEMTVAECEEIGYLHYLLARRFYTGAAEMSDTERRRHFESAHRWFERAYVYVGSEASYRFADFCEQAARNLRPGLYAIAS